MLSRQLRDDRQRLEPGRPIGHRHRAAYSGSKFALAGWSESLAMDLDRLRRLGEADPARRHRHRDLGPARQRRPALRRSQGSPEGIARASSTPSTATTFEHYLPDMKAVIEMKTSDIDSFMRRHARHDRPGMAARERMKALLFGAPPSEESGPHPATSWRPCWPAALRPARDRRRPAGPPGLGDHQAHPLGHLRLGRQAGAGRLQHGRHRQSDGGILLPPPRPRARGGGRGGRAGTRGPGLEVGQRVVLNPWLTCGPRGIEPLCPPCAAGDLSLCWSFTKGDLGPGRARRRDHRAPPVPGPSCLAAHDSMLIPVPDGISNEAAVLADPFSVSFHAIVRHPPPPGGRVLVYGAGRAGPHQRGHPAPLYPDVEVGVVARFEAQHDMARSSAPPRSSPTSPAWRWSRRWPSGRAPCCTAPRRAAGDPPGAHRRRLRHHRQGRDPRGGRARPGRAGPPRLHRRGHPERWESTPIYFKELTIAGSNAFGMEDLDGVRQHAIAHYLELVADGRLDITPMLTHRFALTDWWPALKAIARQDESGALKVAFTPNGLKRGRLRARPQLAEALVARRRRPRHPGRDRARSGARRWPSATSR
jgi:hypothetical protein